MEGVVNAILHDLRLMIRR